MKEFRRTVQGTVSRRATDLQTDNRKNDQAITGFFHILYKRHYQNQGVNQSFEPTGVSTDGVVDQVMQVFLVLFGNFFTLQVAGLDENIRRVIDTVMLFCRH